jgi:dUTP pyrophosphatase
VIAYLKKVSSLVRYAPFYRNHGDSGFDLEAAIDSPISVFPMGRVAIPCGLSFELPAGYELQVRPRSGLFVKHGIMAVFGTVDNGYRGEVSVMLINLGTEVFTIEPKMRVAQAVVMKTEKVGFQFLTELLSTARGDGGFGSTGV